MSTDPTGLGNDNCVSATSKKYINVNFDKSDWCNYEGDCLIDSMIFGGKDICMLCGYRLDLNVPAILERKMKERIRRDILKRKFTL